MAAPYRQPPPPNQHHPPGGQPYPQHPPSQPHAYPPQGGYNPPPPAPGPGQYQPQPPPPGPAGQYHQPPLPPGPPQGGQPGYPGQPTGYPPAPQQPPASGGYGYQNGNNPMGQYQDPNAGLPPGMHEQDPYGQQQPQAYQPYMQNARDTVIPDPRIVPVDPSYMTLTNTHLPRSQTQQQTNLSIACISQPMSPDGEAVPVVQFPDHIGVVRCRRCRAYINPFVQWIANGDKWVCNLCGTTNDCKPRWRCRLDQNNMRTDLMQHPEFWSASVDIVAPEEYMIRSPQPPAYIFLIHTHADMVKSGALGYIADSIRDHIDELPGDQRTRVMIVTYDSAIHFYKCQPGTKNPQILTVPDIENPIMPCPSVDVFAMRYQAKDLLEKVLDSLPSLYENSTDHGNCLGSAIMLTMRAASQVGGKIMVFNWGRPNLGPGKLEDRLTGIPLDDAEQQHNLQLSKKRQVEDYYMRSIEATKFQQSIDLYQFTGVHNEYCDLATLRELPMFSGGGLRYYPRYNNERDGQRLYSDIQRELTRETGWEAVYRIRCSIGHCVRNYLGSFHRRSRDLLSVPVVHGDMVVSFDLLLKHPDVAVKENVGYIQAALLYTTSEGERRIRIHNVPVPIAKSDHQLWEGVQMPATQAWVAKQNAMRLTVQPLGRGRLNIQESLTNVARVYASRTHRRLATMADYPPSWQTWPLICLGMLKSEVFRDQPHVHADLRAAYWFHLWTCGMNSTDLLFRPSIYPLHHLVSDTSLGVWQEDNTVTLPVEVDGTMASIDIDGLYLVDDSYNLVLFANGQFSEELAYQLFQMSSMAAMRNQQPRWPAEVQGLSLLPYPGEDGGTDTLLHRVWHCIEYLRSLMAGRSQTLICCTPHTAEFSKFKDRLFEDRTQHVMEYGEFLTFIRDQPMVAPAKK